MDTITRAFPRDITSWIVACFLVFTGSIWWHQVRSLLDINTVSAI